MGRSCKQHDRISDQVTAFTQKSQIVLRRLRNGSAQLVFNMISKSAFSFTNDIIHTLYLKAE
jgi:hypothetical protein